MLINPETLGSWLKANVAVNLFLAVGLCSVSPGITKNVHGANTTTTKAQALSIVTGKFIDGSADVRHFVQTDSIPLTENINSDDIMGKRQHRQQHSLYGYVIETDKNKGTVVVREHAPDSRQVVTMILPVDSSKCAWRTWNVSKERQGDQKILKISVNGQPEKTLKWNFRNANKT